MVERVDEEGLETIALERSSDLTVMVPEAVTIAIDLPAEPVPDAPDDERAVAIPELVVDPGLLLTNTRSVRVPSLLAAQSIEAAPAPDPIPPLPARPASKRRALAGRPVRALPPDASAPPTDDLPADTAQQVAAKRTRSASPKKSRDERPAPEGVLQNAVYRGTFRRVNPGDSLRARQRKAVDARIAALPAAGTAFVPVLSRKGGVGTTTVAALLGMALADVRDDRVLAIDAHPDRGALASRVSTGARSTVRDVVTHSAQIGSSNDFAAYVARDETRLDVLAAETSPSLGLGFDQGDFGVITGLAERFYGLALVDAGGSVTHSVLRALLARADGLVVVTGGSLDEAQLASETLDWLEAKGYQDLVHGCVVVINTATVGTDVRALEPIRTHFAARARDVVILPYDPGLAIGAVIEYDRLELHTREAARDLAAVLVDGLAPAPASDPAPEESTR